MRISPLRAHDSKREFCPLNLEVRDENEIFYQYLRVRDEIEIFSFKSHVSRFESYFLEVEREKMNLILTRIFEIDNSRYALSQMD